MFSKLPSSPGVLEVCKCWIHECPSYQRLSAVFFTWTSYLSQWKWKRSEMLWGILNCRKWYLKLMGLRNQKRSVFIVHSPMKIAMFEMCLKTVVRRVPRSLPSATFRALSKQSICQVPTKKHSAKKSTRQRRLFTECLGVGTWQRVVCRVSKGGHSANNPFLNFIKNLKKKHGIWNSCEGERPITNFSSVLKRERLLFMCSIQSRWSWAIYKIAQWYVVSMVKWRLRVWLPALAIFLFFSFLQFELHHVAQCD